MVVEARDNEAVVRDDEAVALRSVLVSSSYARDDEAASHGSGSPLPIIRRRSIPANDCTCLTACRKIAHAFGMP